MFRLIAKVDTQMSFFLMLTYKLIWWNKILIQPILKYHLFGPGHERIIQKKNTFTFSVANTKIQRTRKIQRIRKRPEKYQKNQNDTRICETTTVLYITKTTGGKVGRKMCLHRIQRSRTHNEKHEHAMWQSFYGGSLQERLQSRIHRSPSIFNVANIRGN